MNKRLPISILGLTVFTDRYYTRPQLAYVLAQYRTWLTGTVMGSAKYMPQELVKDYANEIKKSKPGKCCK